MEKVFVSGGSGFISLHLISKLIQEGYQVRTSLRSLDRKQEVIDAVEKKWLFNWQKVNFKGKKNSDLWIRFLKVYKKHKVSFQWIKGHNNHPQNERCDTMASIAAKKKNLARDIVFETNNKII